jgi:hypothetical protein
MTVRTPDRRPGPIIILGLLVCLAACADAGPTEPPPPLTLGAKAAAPPKVNQAVPATAPQDTMLTVRVIGSGFDHGSAVRFLLDRKTAPGMEVSATRFVSADSLDVDLTVAANAEVAFYDIEVTTLRGKKGIGTEMFEVKLKGAPQEMPVVVTFRDAAADGVKSDLGGSYDAVFRIIGNLFLDARDRDLGRKLCMWFQGQPDAPDDACDFGYLSTADPETPGGFPAMDVGSAMMTVAQVTWVMAGYNWFLRFGQEDCGTGSAVDNRATVTHPDENTWILEGAGACLLSMKVKGRPEVLPVGFFSMPFQLTVHLP